MAERSYHAHIHLTRSQARQALEDLKQTNFAQADWRTFLVDRGIAVSALPQPSQFRAPDAAVIDQLIEQAETLAPSDQEAAGPWGFLVAFVVMALGSP